MSAMPPSSSALLSSCGQGSTVARCTVFSITAWLALSVSSRMSWLSACSRSAMLPTTRSAQTTSLRRASLSSAMTTTRSPSTL